jgi:tetratricopeptide (TPR) repeat protein
MRHGRLWLALSVLAFSGWAAWSAAQQPKPPADDPPADPAAEEAKEKAVADRFRQVLETNPRRGTALDRLYGYHVERGTLGQLIGEYRTRIQKGPKDGTAWMIVGLLEAQRGKDAAAVEAFRKAEEHLSTNAIPPYYLGQSLVLVGQPDAAAQAFERAIARKPNRTDLLDVFQALGRVYQRSQRPEKALEVWDRLEKLFPDDPRVQEQIATTLVEEGQYAQALPRLEKLISQTDDQYRKATLRMDAADLKVKLKKTPDALADFEKLLAELNPESWLYRDVRRRVEEVFLRNDDVAGLAKYYEAWLDKNPKDVDAVARLARTLATSGRAPDARKWLERGIELAPTNRSLRQALIDQYVFEQNFAAAAAQYEAMDKADPNNPDALREWGKMLLRDQGKPEADRKKAASAVWRRMLDKKPNDPVTASQVADLLRSAGITDEAIELYKKAIALSPDAPQYREYLGEYLHSLKRPDEALAAWRPIAEGANRNAKNLARLAEVFAGFGYRKEAVAAMADAVALEKNDFNLLTAYADLLHQDGQNGEAMKQLDAATKFVSSPEEAEQILIAQIKVYQAEDKLADKIDELARDLDAGKDATADRWHRLARYFEANRQSDKATEAIAKAAETDPKSVPILASAARMHEAGGNLLAAADANRKLAALDRRFRTEYLTNVAKLEQRLGRREQAIQAGRDLLAASPGNPETYKFFADLCFALGDAEEGLEALRRSVRANPSDPQGLITLSNALAERVRQGEAIELLWRAFEKTTDLEGRLPIVERLAQLYLEQNQFDRLMERLERERREAEKAREMTMCIAQAYQTAGDLGTARQQLERLLTDNTRDQGLLAQLSQLCESEGDAQSALKYQRLLVAAAPANTDHQLRLAQLLVKVGESQEAADIWVKLVAGDSEPHRNLQAIDQLITANKHDPALAVLTRMLAQKPGNWELLYREGAVFAAMGKPDEAKARFESILAMKLSDDEAGAALKHEREQKNKPKPGTPGTQNPPRPRRGARQAQGDLPPLQARLQVSGQVRRVAGMEEEYYYGQQQQPFWAPHDYGAARMAALGWLYGLARQKDQHDALVKKLKEAKDKPGDARAAWDWVYLQSVRNDSKGVHETVLALSKAGDPAGTLSFLQGLPGRVVEGQRRYSRRPGEENVDKTPPLPADQLAHVLACYRKLKQTHPDWVTPDVTQAVMTELKRAKREDEEKALYKEMIDAASTPEKVLAVIGTTPARNDLDTFLALFQKLEKLQGPVKSAAALPQLPTRQTANTFADFMAKKAKDKAYPDALRLMDVYLSAARRQKMAAPKVVSTTRRAAAGNGTQIYLAGRAQGPRGNVHVPYPSPNEYYDEGSISLLYNAFDQYKQADLLSDLFAHVRKQLAAAQGGEKVYLHLALGYLHWWADEKEEALAQLTEATRAAPGDHALVMEVADLREKNNEHDAALALLDSITPLDHQMMQRREMAALRLAERTGNVERARLAAERLFGLRLDADTQLELAGQMHRLGQHEMAETVLNRAQRQAGNKTATLLRLMSQYQTQNQTDLAVQIAKQVLRRGPSGTFNPYGGRDQNDSAREQAIGVLARSGQLKDLIERAEAQAKASPKSVPLLQALLDYYRAAGDKTKQKETILKIVELKPDDGKLRFFAAQQLQQLGDNAAAIEQYKVGIRKEPALFGYRYWEVQQLFSQANKFEELTKLMDEIDLRKLSNAWTVIEMTQPLLQEERTRPMGLSLFRKCWKAFPEYRSYLLSNITNDQIWRLPEIFDYAKQAVIPKGDADEDPWSAATSFSYYGNEGRIEGVVTRLLSVARRQQRLGELKAEVEAELAKRPTWQAGKAMLAVIEIQSGNKDRGRKLWEEVFLDPKADVPAMARFIMTQELEFYSGVEDLAVKTLEAGVEEVLTDYYEFSYSPARRLVWWYEQVGRKDDARALTRKALKLNNDDPGYYPGGYWQYRQVSNKISVANELLRVGEPVEAVRLFNELLADRDMLNQANQYYGGERFDQQVEAGLKNAMKALKPSVLPAAVGSLLTPREEKSADKQALDLVVLIESRDLTRASMNSMFAAAVKSTEKSPEARKEAAVKVADLLKKYPNDFSVGVAAALVALADGKPDVTAEAVDRLVKLTEAVPLEPLPPDGKANSRQRADALAQVPLWLVARECLKRDEYRPAGEKLAARAAESAKRQQDPLQAAAILREWGQMALDKGDKATAEAKWSELLALVMPKPKAKKPTPAAAAPAPAPAPAAPGGPPPGGDDGPTFPIAAQVPVPPAPAGAAPAPVPAPTGGAVPVLTASQFSQAVQVANLAADKGMTGLSLKAMRDALRGGPPVADPMTDRRRVRFVGGMAMDEGGPQADAYGSVSQLVPKWRKLKVPPAEVYDVLLVAVLPDARPAEVFLPRDGWGGGDPPRGLGRLLAEVAVEAGKVDDLRKRLEARAGQPLGELPARILLAALALQARDDAKALELLKVFGERVQKDTLQTTSDLVAGVALAALDRPALAPTAEPILTKIAMNYAVGNNADRAAQLGERVVQYHIDRGDLAGAKALLTQAEQIGQRFARGDDAGLHTRLAEQYLRAGFLEDAMRNFAVAADAAATAAGNRPGVRRDEPQTGSWALLVRMLLQTPADKRYPLLKDWSMPTSGRRSVRYFVGQTPRHVPPPAFGPYPVPAYEYVSTMTLLIDAARETGKLPELTAEADRLAAEKVENADLFRALAYLTQGKGKQIEADVKKFAESARQRMTAKPEEGVKSPYYGEREGPVTFHPSELLFVRLCLADPALVPVGDGLLGPMLDRAQNTHNVAGIAEVVKTWDRLGAKRAGAPDALETTGLARWHTPTARSVWFAQDGYVKQGANDQPSYLLFDTPLGGTFEFSVDAYQGHYTEGHAGYAGVVYEPNRQGVPSAAFPVNRNEDQVQRPAPEGIRNEDFNRITIQVEPGKVRCLLNGQLFYEDTDPSPTSPWLMLYSSGGRRPVFRNFVLTGKPEVLPEVKLSAGNYLEGWMTHATGGSVQPRLVLKEPPEEQTDRRGRQRPPPSADAVYDWSAKDGEIVGRKLDGATRPVPSKLAYFRPLRPGESVRYEFFYQPGEAQAHPSLGRLVFLLEPDGVKLHWLTDLPAADWTGLKADNAVAEPGRGPDKLPLKPGEWNAVTLSVTADTLKIELNGTPVYERKLEADVERMFGVFHYRDKYAARVRNVVLTGPWPKKLESTEEAAFVARANSPAEAKARRWQINERYFATEAGDVVEKARKLPPAERYQALAAWVLPNDGRPAFQMAGRPTAQYVLGVVDRKEQPDGRRVMLGNRLDAPALELVAAAKEAGKLDELIDRVRAADTPAADNLFRRSKAALLAVALAAQGRDAEAAKELQSLLPFADKMDPGANAPERWPDLIAAVGTMDHPGLLPDVTKLLQSMNKNLEQAMMQNKQFEGRDWWVRYARYFRAQAMALGLPDGFRRAYGSDPGLAHWSPVASQNSWSRSQGWGTPHWVYRDGVLTHYPGHSEDYLFLRAPLRGNFEVECDLLVHGWRECHVWYGGGRLDADADLKRWHTVANARHDGRWGSIPEPARLKQGGQYHYKLAVKDGVFTMFLNGKEAHSERIGPNADPWLKLHANMQATGELRNLKITGSPAVPDRIELTADDGLPGWEPYLGNVWARRGEEVFHGGARPEVEEGKPEPSRLNSEAALFYHRSFLEDGAVEYEFYHDPGKCLAHPTLDRLVFLLEPDGVKLHWLTDGPHERSGVKVDNVTDEPANRRGPSKLAIKPHAWNRMKLTVVGDTVKLWLNGELIYERPIEPTNQRYFGLFHYTDRTEARVRNVVLTGDWPKQLPPADKLFEKK